MNGVRLLGWFLGRVLLVLLAVFAALWLVAPRVELDREAAMAEMRVAMAEVPSRADALTAWLAAREDAVPDRRPGSDKRIVWAGADGAVTPLSVVYIHGFSASAEEIRPVPDRVAEALGANLHFTRLRGHGRDGTALAASTAEEWLTDTAEALEIGRRIGTRVLVLTTSTGGPLMALAAEAGVAQAVDGIVFVSPNFRVNNFASGALEWPGAQWWMPVVAGDVRSFRPTNEGHAAHWTTRYPSAAVFPMAATVRAARQIDYAALDIPALFLTAEADRVVDPDVTAGVAARWGGPVRQIGYELGPGDDPYAHVIAGDILSPGQTDRVVADILDWARDLP